MTRSTSLSPRFVDPHQEFYAHIVASACPPRGVMDRIMCEGNIPPFAVPLTDELLAVLIDVQNTCYIDAEAMLDPNTSISWRLG